MKPIYTFDREAPPALHEAMLRAELRRQEARRRTALLAAAGLLLQVAMALAGILALAVEPRITVFCFLYVLISCTGGGVMAVVLTKKGGFVS